jgi:phasin family protein
MEFVMSSLDLEQSIAAQKASFEVMFGILSKALESIDKLASLNLRAFKTILAENQEIAAGALLTKNPQELLSLQTQPAVEKAQLYWRHVYEIISGTLTEFAETVETHFKRHRYDWQAFVENLAGHTPAGNEAFWPRRKSAIETATATLETAWKATKQRVQIAESKVTSALEAPTGSTTLGLEQTEAVDKE